MNIKFWDPGEGLIGLRVEAKDGDEQKSMAKILEGLKSSLVISMELGGKAYKGSISHWHEGRKGLFTKVTEFIEMNFWPA